MSSAQVQFARRSPGLVSRVAADRRRHKRVAVALLGRFMRANKQEFPCKLHDISIGGAAIMSPVELELGERVIAYFDTLGGLEGTVARCFEGGFAIRLIASQHKREKLAGQLTWILNHAELDGIEARRHARTALAAAPSTLTLSEGIAISCQVLDISISGASIAVAAKPAIGSDVTLGKLRARVVRHHDSGIGVAFSDIQNPAALRRYFG